MRKAAVAGRFYPSDRYGLIESIEWCFSHGPGMPGADSRERRISAVVVPHAGYACSGMVAAHSFGALAGDGHPDAYIVIGPDHYGTCRGSTMCSEDYSTPLGICPVHRGISERLSSLITDDPAAHISEHSVEVEVPFLQYIDPDAEIVPIIMGDQSYGSAVELADSLKVACEGYDVAVIASTDMSHYIPKEAASRYDGMVLDRIAEMDVRGMYDVVLGNHISMCGYGPVAVAMMMSEGCGAEVLDYADSFDSLGYDRNAVVGYASAVMRRSREL